MIRNHLTIAFRTLLRNSSYSFINIAGLTVGLAASILIALWVVNEITYDSFHANRSRLQQVVHYRTVDGHIESPSGTPVLMREEFKKFPTLFRNSTISDHGGSHVLAVGNERIRKEGRHTGPEFLEMFRFELVSGSRATALADPHSIVVTEALATILFGNADPMNKVIRIDNAYDVKVTGVLKNVPANSSMRFNYILPFALYSDANKWVKECTEDWRCDWINVFVELQPGVEPAELNKRFANILNEKKEVKNELLFFYPMDRWQLYGEFRDGHEDGGRIEYVYGFSALGLFIIVVACINFINLSTARSERRAREVGIRKISGSQRYQLILQFLGESIALVAISFVLAVLLIELSLPLFNSLVKTHLTIDFSSLWFWTGSLALILVVGVLAGAYPAFYLSSFNPARVLKGRLYPGGHTPAPRRMLVIFQFAFSTFVIIGSIVIYRQITFVQQRQLGYDNKYLLELPDNPELQKNYKAFKNELLQSGAVSSVTKSNASITDLFEMNYMELPGGGQVEIVNLFSEYDFLKTMGIRMIEGRDFLEGNTMDTARVILNQAAVKLLGYKDPIGRIATIAERKLEIVGVTEDVLQGDPFGIPQPTYTLLVTDWKDQHGPYVAMRLRGDNSLAEEKKIRGIITKYSPSYPLEYSFADTAFGDRLGEIRMLLVITNMFSFLTIFIASLGLLGLSTYTVERRSKELSVRKVLGASIAELMLLVSRDFIRIVFTAIVLAGPLAYLFFTRFLERYQYHIEMSWSIILITGIVTLLMAVGVISTQTYRAGLVNPVEKLKND